MTLGNKTTRNRLVDAFRSLDEDCLGNVTMKKDVNPTFRGEWRRLYEVERKTKLANPDSSVIVDKIKSRVWCDDKIVDYWHP